MTTKYYKATFSNGQVETRSTASRTYTHAHACSWNACHTSWAGSEALAVKAAKGAEIAPAVEITAQEYRALKAGARS
jgi:hypothetical protein